MIKFKSFTTRDLAFIGLIIAIMYIVQTITILGVSALTPIDAFKSIASAFFVCIVISIGLAKVGKIGTFTIIGLVNGIICGFIMPAFLPLLPATFLGGLAGDITVGAFYGAYSSRNSLVTGIGVAKFIETVVILTVPFIFGFSKFMLAPALIIVSAVVVAILGILGALVGYGIIIELRKAGAME
ncbi:MptD family putative ECF transporter S component [Methanothermobacter tenebrarum]|uniref:Uncharacterized protein n=1 Tax=Methanothermobacter tenebrarum TaxID=680118 RepID=A0A328PGR5_9EURY|nr:MptD family putative ECF transporter S component [Methanothermobacter tenebrarum]NPV64759.1 hypothetical protein [Methanobacteriaceae archaeon]BAW31172.1 conserved hypothetical protein [Methanothermobacter sp. MT-2]HHW05078.1 MptD family putative ECF transporter S component [Methanothermobacter sp.]RAO78604.1 hypothetical protein DPC56_07015 [Methanothermobacter tenebrarum]HOK73449.1 MptD family putative ECF transporter S component [Methanothermobacter sp.]